MPRRSSPQALQALNAVASTLQAGDGERAFQQLGEIHRRFGPSVELVGLLAQAAMATKRYRTAAQAADDLTRAVPRNPQAWMLLAAARRRAGDFDGALTAADRAVALDPDNHEAHRRRAAALIELGRRAEALDAVRAAERLLAKGPVRNADRLFIDITFAATAPDPGDPHQAIERLRRSVVLDDVDPAQIRPAWWQIARLLEHVGRYDEAFDALQTMHAHAREPWDPDAHSRDVDRLIDAWSGRGPPPDPEDRFARVVFIVGMPRSGTSLLEQMLAQLDAVTPGGELNIVPSVVARFDPEFVDRNRPLPIHADGFIDERAPIGDTLADEFAKVAPEGVVTDKQPFNFLYLPLLRWVMPGARFVHTRRDPLDNCLSCYTQNFKMSYPWTDDFTHLARYHGDYTRVLDAWHDVLGDDLVQIDYERLVSDPQSTLAPVLDPLGQAWDPAMLDFHRSDRAVPTASRDQVRRPLYTSSVGRAERFGHALDPLRNALGVP